MLKGLILFLSIFIYSGSFADEPVKTNGAITIGDKQWKLGFKDENKNSLIQEYVTNNETVDHWTYLFSFHRFKIALPKEITPQALAENQVMALKNKGYQHVFTNLASSPDEALVEFRITSPLQDQQDELERIIKTPSGEFIILHYAIRKSDMGDAERNKWADFLKNIDLNLFAP